LLVASGWCSACGAVAPLFRYRFRKDESLVCGVAVNEAGPPVTRQPTQSSCRRFGTTCHEAERLNEHRRDAVGVAYGANRQCAPTWPSTRGSRSSRATRSRTSSTSSTCGRARNSAWRHDRGSRRVLALSGRIRSALSPLFQPRRPHAGRTGRHPYSSHFIKTRAASGVCGLTDRLAGGCWWDEGA
jgi:hypothetical protein